MNKYKYTTCHFLNVRLCENKPWSEKTPTVLCVTLNWCVVINNTAHGGSLIPGVVGISARLGFSYTNVSGAVNYDSVKWNGLLVEARQNERTLQWREESTKKCSINTALQFKCSITRQSWSLTLVCNGGTKWPGERTIWSMGYISATYAWYCTFIGRLQSKKQYVVI